MNSLVEYFKDIMLFTVAACLLIIGLTIVKIFDGIFGLAIILFGSDT